MSYTPRTTTPATNDLRWTNTGYGGYNRQIVPANYGSLSAWTGSVLANCTGYVHGRWMEIGGVTTEYNLSNGNASTYYGYSDGYQRGSTPKLGAVACYSGGLYGGAGHVAIVEEIYTDGRVLVSQSNYGISIFETVILPAGTYNPWTSQGLVFQGFIYHPSIKPEEPTYNLKVINGTASKYTGKKGNSVSIAWTQKSRYTFHRWELSGSGTIASITSPKTSFTFGSSNATITAIETYRKPISKVMLYSSPQFYKRH